MTTPTTLVLRAGPFSGRIPRRVLVVNGALLGVLLAATAAALMLGSYTIPLDELVAVFGGQGADQATTVVFQWRAPRAVAAAVFGAALALSGAIFQSLTRNPLGSPDIVGFSVGSFTGVLVVIMAGGVGFHATATGALAGGLATAAIIYLVAFRHGMQGFRLIIVGIAISSMLTSVNTWITVKAELGIALRAAVWGAGTLNGLRWSHAVPGIVAVAILTLLLVFAAPAMRQLELGDETAAMQGVRTEPTKLALIVVGVGLTAAVTAVAGPISFVALAAPQLARRLTRTGTITLSTAALVGASLLTLSDLIAQHAFSGLTVPVGAVTVCIGGLYLLWLLTRRR
ncbi:FecCD family ABC transporter permease [Phytoactinopolyspora limicola]|uniref:FecCD family ABC transporter permease n=1 Tax=Phytoactinopolyspora limicola TaxID=2715536 RepID=UPI00140CA83A|nr:iron chelate uptake ABC transporter family permease subunit [Phytoactinopolyspora limicola]